MLILAAILAAGASSRLGRPKQLLKLDGQTLVRRAARAALDANLSRVLVIVGRDAASISDELRDLPVEIVVNPNWREGMASSVRCAVERASDEANLNRALLLTPCDLPRLSSAHLRALTAQFERENAPIVASRYNETLGAPVIFARALWSELLELRGDVGARRVIARHESSFIEWPQGAFDVDTREDWEKFQ